MKNFKVKAQYFNTSIEFEIKAENLAIAIFEGEKEARSIFKKAMNLESLQFWLSEGKISVKEMKSH